MHMIISQLHVDELLFLSPGNEWTGTLNHHLLNMDLGLYVRNVYGYQGFSFSFSKQCAELEVSDFACL